LLWSRHLIGYISVSGASILVHVGEASLGTTKAFTHGSLVFDLTARSVTFGKLPSIALPDGLTLSDGGVLQFQLVGPDGTPRKQKRTGVLRANEKQPCILRIAGTSKTPRKFSASDGWRYETYKYRAYLSHPGLNADNEIPPWLKASISRQKLFWNRMAFLCRQARRQCSPAPTNEIVAFVQNIIVPEIDRLNNALGRSKEKMTHPVKLKTEMPGLDGLWNFVGRLRKRIERGRAVPGDLLDKVVEFAEQFKPDYTPINEFIAGFSEIAKKEALALDLRHFEIRPCVKAFEAILERRKTTKAPFSEGWPLTRYLDSAQDTSWGLHYYFNSAGCDSALLASGEGVPGLTFGPALKPSDTGHKMLTGVAAKRTFREAEISIPGNNHERWNFRFGVLQHRPLPTNSHLKEWKLIHQGGKLWLCLVVELQRAVPVRSPHTAGLDIGWRLTEEGLRFGTLYEAATESFQDLIIDLHKSPTDPKDRVPFRIDLGLTRWDKRNISQILPELELGEPIPTLIEIRSALQRRRDYYKDAAKVLLRNHLGERLPTWFNKAGRRGLLKMSEGFKDDASVQEILDVWRKKDQQIGKLISMYFDRTIKRVEYGQAQVAHDVCRHLQQKGVTRLLVETRFLARASQRQDNEYSVCLKLSQKYRQFVAVGKFVTILKNTAAKYGIVVDAQKAKNTTRICIFCDNLNQSTEKEQFSCKRCRKLIKQDQNAAVNLARFGCNQALAEMALHAGEL
jgi:hypothetical protein